VAQSVAAPCARRGGATSCARGQRREERGWQAPGPRGLVAAAFNVGCCCLRRWVQLGWSRTPTPRFTLGNPPQRGLAHILALKGQIMQAVT